MKDESEVSLFGFGRFRHPMHGLPPRPIMFCALEMIQGNCRSNGSVLQTGLQRRRSSDMGAVSEMYGSSSLKGSHWCP